MSAYLTPERVKTLGLGVDLDNIELSTLRSAITRASATVNAVCAVPRLPQQFDFRGGRMVDEAHVWYIDPYERPHPYQFWPYATPVKTIEAFAIYSTNNIKVEIDPDNIFINNSGGYVELSSLNLTAFGIYGAGLVPLLGLYNPVAKMTYTYGWEFIETDEVLEPIDAQTYAAQHQFWTAATVTVKANGTAVTTGFSVNRKEGWILFDSNQPADTEISASYTRTLPEEIPMATGLILAQDMGESDLRAKGMEGLASVRVKDVELRRTFGSSRNSTTAIASTLPPGVEDLLSGFIFRSS